MRSAKPVPGLTAIPMNGAAATRTLTTEVQQMSSIGYGMAMTYADGTGVEATFKRSYDGGATYQTVPSISVATGTGTSVPYTFKHAKVSAASESTSVSVDCADASHVKAIFVFTGTPLATDLLTVTASGQYENR